MENLHNLAILAAQQNQPQRALELIDRAIAANPSSAAIHNDRGNILQALARFDDALLAYRKAIELDPGYAIAHDNVAQALRQNGDLDGAIASFQKSLSLSDRDAITWSNLASTLRDAGRMDEAEAAVRKSLALDPNLIEAHVVLSAIHRAHQRHQDALDAATVAVRLDPNSSLAQSHLGLALKELRRLDAAVAAFRAAIALSPRDPSPWFNLGNTLRAKGQIDDAAAAYRQSISLDPYFADAWNNYGNALIAQGLGAQAADAFARAVELRPSFASAHSNLIFILAYLPDLPAETLQRELAHFQQLHTRELESAPRPHLNDRDPERPLRIGYVSPDLRNHPVGRFLRPIFANHDHRAFTVVCYSDTPDEDDVTAELRSRSSEWNFTTPLTAAQLADKIRADAIDILVDLTLHTSGNRLLTFARKPAPVQITHLAYPGTSGLLAIDYRFTDSYLDPLAADQSLYTEKPLRLTSYWCYQPPTAAERLEVSPLPAQANGFVTFGCLNNFVKISAITIEVWAALLRAVPTARLLLQADEGAHIDQTGQLFAARGVRPDRLEFTPKRPIAEYFKQYNRIDIALDPFPYNGGTTTCDALWMGVPVVTLAGKLAVHRSGVSILSNSNLPHLVAASPQQYVVIAQSLASDLPTLAKLRSTMRSTLQSSPLFDASSHTREIESAYRHAWLRWIARPSE